MLIGNKWHLNKSNSKNYPVNIINILIPPAAQAKVG